MLREHTNEEPAEPVEPAEPAEPVEPVEPVEPAKSAEPAELTFHKHEIQVCNSVHSIIKKIQPAISTPSIQGTGAPFAGSNPPCAGSRRHGLLPGLLVIACYLSFTPSSLKLFCTSRHAAFHHGRIGDTGDVCSHKGDCGKWPVACLNHAAASCWSESLQPMTLVSIIDFRALTNVEAHERLQTGGCARRVPHRTTAVRFIASALICTGFQLIRPRASWLRLERFFRARNMGISTRSKDATLLVAPGHTTNNKRSLGTKGIATRSKDCCTSCGTSCRPQLSLPIYFVA